MEGISIPPWPTLFIYVNKILDTAVSGSFSIFREIAGREFTDSSVVLYTLTAYTFLVAGESTITKLPVRFFITFHIEIFKVLTF